ncbi:DUF5009 domain-containing protein [bacterium]|nr:DUF5009 domain-containing protein [bacterium]
MADTAALSTARPSVAPPSKTGKRIIAVDVLRGLTIIAMVWVNDMADLVPVTPKVPQWMRHMDGSVNGFTFVDLIIPIFMFLLGCSIPLAIGKRLQRGDSAVSIVAHVIIRAAALIVMGLFDVNRGGVGMPGYGVMANWPLGLWKFLAWSFIFVVWLDFPIQSEAGKWARRIASIAALCGLVWLAFVFRGPNSTPLKPVYFSTSWWGTLGQLGWAYLIAALTWLVFRKFPIGILVVFIAMHAVYAGWVLDKIPVTPWIKWFGRSTLTTYTANTIAGLYIGILLSRNSGPMRKILSALAMAAAAAAAAFALRNIGAPLGVHMPSNSWSLSATAIALAAWAALYWLTDVQGWFTRILDPLRVVGQNSLLIYQLARYMIFIYFLSGLTFYHKLATPTNVGIARSACYALLLAALTYYATKKRVFLKV